MKMFVFRIQFDWSLFQLVQLTIIQNWFRKWLVACSATSHYLNQWWPKLLTHICVIWVNSLNKMDAIWQTTFSVAFSWPGNICILIKFHWKFVIKNPVDKSSSVQVLVWWNRRQAINEPMLTKSGLWCHMASLSHSELTQTIVWHLFGAKSLPELMKVYCQLDPQQLMVSPVQQQSWYWLYYTNQSLSPTGKDFNYLCHLSIKKS